MIKKLAIIILLPLNITSCLNAQDHSAEVHNFSKVEQLIDSAILEGIFPGSVLLVWKDGNVILEKSFGRFTYDVDSPETATNTIFDIASLSKVVATTTAAMICVERNLINLDDKVGKFIPEFAVNNKGNITVRNLLMHNSGLPAWKKYYATKSNKAEVLEDICNSNIDFTPGTKTVYSDLGIIILGEIIAIQTDLSLDEFCRREIFTPLEMHSTFYNPDDSIKNFCAPTELDSYWRNKLLQGEVHDETAYLLDGVAGHAGVFSTASDLGKFMSMIMNYGVYKKEIILKEETIKLFTKRQSGQSSRALGWDTKSEKGSSAGNLMGGKSFGHTGFTGTSIWADPEKNLFVVFLTNRVYPTRENTKIISFRPKLHNSILETILNK